ncbi:hypothetical protein D3C87_2129050 [compost metagenome]
MQVEAVFEGKRCGGGAADLAVVDEDQQTVGVVFELGHGGQQVSFQAVGFVHGWVC